MTLGLDSGGQQKKESHIGEWVAYWNPKRGKEWVQVIGYKANGAYPVQTKQGNRFLIPADVVS